MLMKIALYTQRYVRERERERESEKGIKGMDLCDMQGPNYTKKVAYNCQY